MVRIAIIEDNPSDLTQVTEYLKRYELEHSQSFSVKSFADPIKFLANYRSDFDLIFMDIELPHLSGIEAAKRLRALDAVAALVFITNVEQFAVNGYEVDALDFVVKPINYYRFCSMMHKALRSISKRAEKEILVRSSTKITRLRISQIYYIEIRDHLLIFHSDQGNLDAWGNLSEMEQDLAGYDFVRCSSSYLVNLRYVLAVEGNTVIVAGDRLPISQRKRKPFYDCVTAYLSEK